ncbi:MAG: hypothetical protein ACPGWR_03035 [Ardenticatenaceae bacterium]
MTRMMRDLVEVQGSFKPSVQLPADFFDEELNRHFVESYIPTPEILDIFMEVRHSLQPNSERRAKVFASTFGTGKSDLMLMIANYVTRSPDDPLLEPFFTRLERLNHAKAEAIYQARNDKPPFLLVLLQADTVSTFSSFALNGLSQSLAEAERSELLGTTYYQAALDLIQSWEKEWPVNIRRLEDTLNSEHGQTLTQLKHDLSDAHADLALATFREAVRSAMGMEFQPNTVLKMPYQAFDEVAKQLVASGQYSGVFVIADEFTHLLEKLAQSPTAGDSKAIDNLAEAAYRSGPNQLHFYIVSLYPFASMKGSTELAQAALERIGGRFSQRELRSQNAEELISASITKLINTEHLFDGTLGQEDELLTVAMRLWGARTRDQEWLRDTVVRGCFPLHPLATYCLGPLNRVLAQNERTMFSFIWDQENGLNRFIQKASGEVSKGRLSLRPLEGLFDYFDVSIKEKRPDLWQVYLEATSLLSPPQFDPGLEGQLLRALILLDVASGDPNLRADSDLLRHALGLQPSSLPEITIALEQLQEHGIAYPSQSGHYQLVKPGHANPLELRRLIERGAGKLRGSPLQLLNRDLRYQPRDVQAQGYNSDRGTARKLLARFVSPVELSSPAALSLVLPGQDGLLWYVVAASDQELAQARSAALQLTRQYERFVVAVPHRPTDLVMRWKRKRALEALRKEANYQTPNYQDLLVDSGLVGKDYLDAFKAEREYFNNPRHLEWYRAGRPVLQVTKQAHLSDLATTVMEEVFPATPAHKSAQHLTSSRKTKTHKDALENILQAPFRLKRKGKPAVKAVLLDGAHHLGLVELSGSEGAYDVYNVCLPNEQRSIAVWKELDDTFREGNPLSEVVAKLLSPPYGLYRPVLQLFVAAFYRLNRDHMEVYNATEGQKRPLDITSKEIIDSIENPNQYMIRYQPLTTAQSQFLQGLEQALPPAYHQSGLLTNRVAQSLRRWARQEVSLVARKASPDELAIVFSDVLYETLTAGALLMDAAFLSSASETATALLESVPTRLGLADDASQWTENLKPMYITLQKACQQLQDFSAHFKAQLAWQIGQCFGLTIRSANLDQSLKQALQWRKEQPLVKENDGYLNPDAKSLLRALDLKPTNFEQLFLNDLLSQWRLKRFDEWQEIHTYNAYLERLRQAVAAIEARASELAAEQEAILVQRGLLRETPLQVRHSSQPSARPSQKEAKQTISQPSTAQHSPLLSKRTSTAQSASQPEEYNIQSSKALVAAEEVDSQASHHEMSPVEQAFAEIKTIFSRLSSEEQDALWARLVEEYDPR